MAEACERVVVTGISGNLGSRLISQLPEFDVVGVDFRAPVSASPLVRFAPLDIGREASCRDLVSLLRATEASAVVHLAFVIDPLRTGVLDPDRMWQINVAGTARVMEAVAEANRRGGVIRKFIFPSSVSAYGSDLPQPVTEEAPLHAHTLPYAIHKREADRVAQARAESLGPCATYILRPHIFVGRSVENYLVGSLRGTPTGKGPRAQRMRDQGKRLPLFVPFGSRYRENRFQFLHIDDMARVIAHLLRRPEPGRNSLSVFNVAGRGDSLRFWRCAEIANQRIVPLPGIAACRAVLKIGWKLGISGIPPEALPYMFGSYTMDCSRLRAFLGKDYERVITMTVEDALCETFAAEPALQEKVASA